MNLNEAAFIILTENIQDNQKMTGMNSNELKQGSQFYQKNFKRMQK